MKPIIPFALLGALLAVGAANAAVTTPVGYASTELLPNKFSLVGLTLQNPTTAAGVLDAVSAAPNTVTDSDVDFDAVLTGGATYILELSDGTVQEITSWAGNVLTTPSDLSGLVTPATTTYTLRKAATVSDIFGANNSVGLTPSPDGDTSIADTLQVPSGSGFEVIYYFNDGAGFEGWFTEGGDPAENYVLNYADGFYVKRIAGGPINLVVSGEVKLDPTSGVLANGFNYLGAVAPAGLTLGDSGLEAFISQSSDGDTSLVDTVQVQLDGPSGAYRVCYYFNDGAGFEGWFDEGGDPADDQALDSGFLIFNRDAAKPYTVSVPGFYSTL